MAFVTFPQSASHLVSLRRLAEAWEDRLLGGADAETALPELIAAVRGLWDRYNHERDLHRSNPVTEATGREGYLAAYFFPNIVRAAACLRASPEAMKALRALVFERAKKGAPLRVLDYGAGPLSASLGLLFVLEDLLLQEDAKSAPEVHIFAIDAHRELAEEGRDLLKGALLPRAKVKVAIGLEADMKDLEACDVVLAANVFNELPRRRRLTVGRQLAGLTAERGLMLWLEPGQDVHAKHLGLLRDEFLAAQAADAEKKAAAQKADPGKSDSAATPHTVLSPCTHAGPCPLSARTDRPDWCWFRAEWTVPELLRRLDKGTLLDHRSLAYSYVLFGKGLGAKTGTARVVSDPIFLPAGRGLQLFLWNNQIGGKPEDTRRLFEGNDTLEKILLCHGEDTQLASIFTPGARAATSSQTLERGAVVGMPPQGKPVFSERVGFPQSGAGARSSKGTAERSPRSQPPPPKRRSTQPKATAPRTSNRKP